MTAYLAGMGIDICGAGICLLVLGLAGPHGLARSLLAVAVTLTVIGLSGQFMVFMRTDIYFALQDLSRCANLYADGSGYLRYLGGLVTRRGRHPDPSLGYPAAQRRAIRLYSAVLLAGTAVCLGIEFAVTLPALVTLLARAVSEVGRTVLGSVDGAVALAILLGFQVLWMSRWWHRHQRQVRELTRKYLRAAGS